MPDKTIQTAAHELHLTVLALTELIEREYPKREEVEEKFVSKRGSKRRWATVLSIILLTTVMSFFATVATVSTCFLQGTHPTACNILPGYKETTIQNDAVFAEFLRLQETTERNDRRLDDLEKQEN